MVIKRCIVAIMVLTMLAAAARPTYALRDDTDVYKTVGIGVGVAFGIVLVAYAVVALIGRAVNGSDASHASGLAPMDSLPERADTEHAVHYGSHCRQEAPSTTWVCW